jgi:hypothetical protein
MHGCSVGLWECVLFIVLIQTAKLKRTRAAFANKILTGARNGELVLWDVGRAGTSKYGVLRYLIRRDVHSVLTRSRA